MYAVYVLKSLVTGRTYTGQTEDLPKRLKQHNDKFFGGRSFTKLNGEDWQVVYKEEFDTRREAIKREKQLKSANGRAYIKSVITAR